LCIRKKKKHFIIILGCPSGQPFYVEENIMKVTVKAFEREDDAIRTFGHYVQK